MWLTFLSSPSVRDCDPTMQAKLYPKILAAMKPGATLGLSHGFLLGVMQSDGADFRADIDVVLMAPKARYSTRKLVDRIWRPCLEQYLWAGVCCLEVGMSLLSLLHILGWT